MKANKQTTLYSAKNKQNTTNKTKLKIASAMIKQNSSNQSSTEIQPQYVMHTMNNHRILNTHILNQGGMIENNNINDSTTNHININKYRHGSNVTMPSTICYNYSLVPTFQIVTPLNNNNNNNYNNCNQNNVNNIISLFPENNQQIQQNTINQG